MIEKILERLEAEMNEVVAYDEDDYYLGKYAAYGSAISIVQEVAKEYDGRVIELPCKVGDTVYLPWKYNGQMAIANLKVNKIIMVTGVMRVITDFETDDEGFFEECYGGMFDFSDFGKDVFLTRSEAEEALAKMGGK